MAASLVGSVLPDRRWKAEFFVARVPLMPAATIRMWHAACPLDLRTLESSAETYRDVTEDLASSLRRLSADPLFGDALLVATEELVHAIGRTSNSSDDRLRRRAISSLLRYAIRATSRTTPFGMFAGTCTGKITTGPTRIELKDPSLWRIHTTLDSEVVIRVAEELNVERDDHRWVVFRPNSSVALRGDWFYYIEAKRLAGRRKYEIARCQADEPLRFVLEYASAGVTRASLIEALSRFGYTDGESSSYVTSLIEASLLVSDAIPAVVSDEEPLNQLIKTLSNTPRHALSEKLQALAECLAAGDQAGPTRGEAFFSHVRTLAANIDSEVPASKLMQTDLRAIAGQAELNNKLVEELITTATQLDRCQPAPQSGSLSRFRERFVARYDRMSVPLLEALDPEFGIGFDDTHGEPAAGKLAEISARSEYARILGELVAEATRAGQRELVLTQDMIERIGSDRPSRLPDSFCIAAVLGDDDGRQVRFESASGPSGVEMLGRFCRWDVELRDHVTRHLATASAFRPATVFAEVVHWPEDRIGNILRRPSFSDFEIVYLGKSMLPAARQIPASDLELFSKDDRMVLWSVSLKREVVPRLTSAHNHAMPTNLPVYRFLCALQAQPFEAPVRWDWDILERNEWLPRVRLGDVVVSRERWRLGKSDLRRIAQAKGHARYKAVQVLRRKFAWPDELVVVEGDRELLLNLDNPIAVECLADELSSATRAYLAEAWPHPVNGIAASPRGRHATEIHIPVIRIDRATAPVRSIQRSFPPAVGRCFPPGSDWLYMKLYGGKILAYEVLREIIWPMVRSALDDGTALNFFWLRYSDPESHLRVRVLGREQIWNEWYPRVALKLGPLLNARQLARVELGTYEREIERYGGEEGVLLAEQHFGRSSEFALETDAQAALAEPSEKELYRAIVGVLAILSNFNLPAADVVEALSRSLGAPRAPRGVGDVLFRTYRKSLALCASPVTWSAWSEMPDAREAFPVSALQSLEDFLDNTREIASRVIALEGSGVLTCRRSDFAMSLVHMHINRLIAVGTRKHETVVYAVLMRLFSSVVARSVTSM